MMTAGEPLKNVVTIWVVYMMTSSKWIRVLFYVLFMICISQGADDHADMIVAQDGSGDYTTIGAAIDALPMYTYRRTVIFIKNGVYEEKIRIEPNYITLRGESRDQTIIRYAQARPDWQQNKDAIGPAVINSHGDDLVLDSLTIENSLPDTKIHAFAVYGTGTRTVIVNCNVFSQGGDTVSLWNYRQGMYYHRNCRFRGAVDFVCPRGWCFIRDCSFEITRTTAALWHAGGFREDQKFVLRDCTFNGQMPYELGRHHYEAQFYLLDCHFSKTMLDKPIYRVVYDDPAKNNPYLWGDRRYFFNCHRQGGDYPWFRDNLDQAPSTPSPEQITPAWTFGGAWDPESHLVPWIVRTRVHDRSAWLTFNEIVTVHGRVTLQTHTHKTLTLVPRRFTDIDTLEFASETPLVPEDLRQSLTLSRGQILASTASTWERHAGPTLSLPLHWRDCLDQSASWYDSDEAVRIADNVLLYQRVTQGWDKNINMARLLTDAEKQVLRKEKSILRSTIDNGATVRPMRYLAKVYKATGHERFKKGVLKGLDYLLQAQYPNGGWAQFYPIRQGYYQHITFNDDAMINVMRLLREVVEGHADLTFVPTDLRKQAGKAIDKGLDIILRTQVRVDDRLTVWCAQYNRETLQPAPARTYEPVSLSGMESVEIVRYLMDIENPSQQVRRAIKGACAWFAEVPIHGVCVVEKPDPTQVNGFDRVLVPDPNAPRLWARFYEIGTNKPLYVDRDGIAREHYNDLSAERRNDYSYLGPYAEDLLDKDYPAWLEKWSDH